MSSVALQDRNGKSSGSIDLDQNIFGIEPNVAVMHQVVTAQLAARRSGTQSTKTRSVRGGAKPWRQRNRWKTTWINQISNMAWRWCRSRA